MGNWQSWTEPVYARTHLLRLRVPEQTSSTSSENGRFYESTHFHLDPRKCNSFDHLIATAKHAFSLDEAQYRDARWRVYCVLENQTVASEGAFIHLSKLIITPDTPADAIVSYLAWPYTFYFEEDPNGRFSYGVVYE